MLPCILHVDMDAFFASVEQLRNPRLRGKPVAVGSGVIASASYEARSFGLQAGMPLQRARQLCPEVRILQGHAAIYRCFSERIFVICAEYSPALEIYLDEAYCDWNGTERLYPNPEVVAAEIRRRVEEETGLTVTAGIGRNRMLAKMASKSAKPNGLRRICAEEEDNFIRGLPVSRLPGVGPRTERLFQRLNIHTIEEMRLLSRESLRAMLGVPGLILFDRCRGLDTQPVSAREVPRSIQRETSFHKATTDRETIEGTLYYLTERAANTARQLRLKARQLGVKICYQDGEEERSIRKLSEPTSLDPDLFVAAAAILRMLFTRRVALHRVGVLLAGLVTEDGLEQLSLFDDTGTSLQPNPEDALVTRRRKRRLIESLDAIRKRYGHASVVCGQSLNLLGKLEQDDHGFILRTSSLTQ